MYISEAIQGCYIPEKDYVFFNEELNRYNKLKELIKILLELGYHTLAIKKQLFLRFMIGVKVKYLK